MALKIKVLADFREVYCRLRSVSKLAESLLLEFQEAGVVFGHFQLQEVLRDELLREYRMIVLYVTDKISRRLLRIL